LLKAADRKRGFNTALLFLDDPATMRRYGGRAVTDPMSGQQHKEAIDAIYAASEPEYLVILDAADVIPHVSMINPTATTTFRATCPTPAIRPIAATPAKISP
jgi:hypothetical protein